MHLIKLRFSFAPTVFTKNICRISTNVCHDFRHSGHSVVEIRSQVGKVGTGSQGHSWAEQIGGFGMNVIFDSIDSLWYQLYSFYIFHLVVLLYYGVFFFWHPFNSRRITKGHPVKIRIILLGYCLCPSPGSTSGLLWSICRLFIAVLCVFYVRVNQSRLQLFNVLHSCSTVVHVPGLLSLFFGRPLTCQKSLQFNARKGLWLMSMIWVFVR